MITLLNKLIDLSCFNILTTCSVEIDRKNLMQLLFIGTRILYLYDVILNSIEFANPHTEY